MTTSRPSAEARHAITMGAEYEDEGSGDRQVHHRYDDPLDLIWIASARRLGIEIQRSDGVFASWDGRGTLTLSTASGFDPDDCLAQLVLHEICHSLVEGPAAWDCEDWGLSNVDVRDLSREHAAQRLQAALADRYELREFLAVTTKWRDYYDALGAHPLDGPEWDPAVALARAGFTRSQCAPTRTVLDQALRATAAIAETVAPFVRPESLWARAATDRSTAARDSGSDGGLT